MPNRILIDVFNGFYLSFISKICQSMNKQLSKKQKKDLIKIYEEFRDVAFFTEHDFINLTQMYIEARQGELSSLLNWYELNKKDSIFMRFQSTMQQILQSLKPMEYFKMERVIRLTLNIVPQCELIVKLHEKENQEFELQYSLKASAQDKTNEDSSKIQVAQCHEEISKLMLNQKNERQQNQENERKKKYKKMYDNIFDLVINKKDIDKYLLVLVSKKQYKLSINKRDVKQNYRYSNQNYSITLFFLSEEQLNQSILEQEEGLLSSFIPSFMQSAKPGSNEINVKKYLKSPIDNKQYLVLISESSFRKNPQVEKQAIWIIFAIIVQQKQQFQLKDNQTLILLKELSNNYSKSPSIEWQFNFLKANKQFVLKQINKYFLIYLFSIFQDRSDLLFYKLDIIKKFDHQSKQNKIYIDKQKQSIAFIKFNNFKERIRFYKQLQSDHKGEIVKNIETLLSKDHQNTFYLLWIIAAIYPSLISKEFHFMTAILQTNQSLNHIGLYALLFQFISNYTSERYKYHQHYIRQKEIIIKSMEIIARKIQKKQSQMKNSLEDDQQYAEFINLKNMSEKLSNVFLQKDKPNEISRIFMNEEILKIYSIYKIYFVQEKLIFQSFEIVAAPIIRKLQSALKDYNSCQVIQAIISEPMLPHEENIIDIYIKQLKTLSQEKIRCLYKMFDKNINHKQLVKILQANYNKNKFQFLQHFHHFHIFNDMKIEEQKLKSIFQGLANLIEIKSISVKYEINTSIPKLLQTSSRIKTKQCRKIVFEKIINQVIQQTGKEEAEKIIFQIMQHGIDEQGQEEITQIAWVLFESNLNFQQFQEALQNNSKKLMPFQKLDPYLFNHYISKLSQKINRFQITNPQYKKLRQNKINYQRLRINITLFEAIKNLEETLVKHKRDCEELIQLLRQQPCFQAQIQQIQMHGQQIQQNRYDQLATLLQIPPQLQQIFKKAYLIKLLKQTQYWRKQDKIVSIPSFMQCYVDSIQNLKQKVRQYQEADISIGIFANNFIKCKGLQKILSTIDDLDKATTAEIIQSIVLFNQKTINLLIRFGLAYRQIHIMSNQSQPLVNFVQAINQIKQSPQKKTIIAQREYIKKRVNKMCKFFQINQQQGLLASIDAIKNNDLFKVFDSTQRCVQLHQFIKNQRINTTQIQDLYEYLQQMEESKINMENIKQFHKVFSYYEHFNKYEIDIVQIKQIVKEMLNDKIYPLYECLQSCHSLLEQFTKMFWKLKNRQISFKIQIQQILRYSILSISFQDSSFQLTINLNPQTKSEKITWKQLTIYKQKSMLIIKDMKKNIKDSSNINNTLKILQDYEQLYGKVNRLYNNVNQLYNLGYDPKRLQTQITIQQRHFQELDLEMQNSELLCREWKQIIKQTYSKSYLLTHFIGPKLNTFKNQLFQQQYLKIYQRLLGLNEERFNRFMKIDQQFKLLMQQFEKHDEKPINQLVFLSNMANYLTQDRISASKEQNKIEIIVCQPKYFYSCLVDQKVKQFASITQVLMCQNTTTLQQIQCFLYRAIMNQKTHFIVASHFLNQEVKSQFIDLITSLYSSQSKDIRKAKLCFVTNKTNDKIIGLLTKKNRLIDSSLKQLTQKTCEDQTKKMINYLRQKTIVFQSQKAGMGKTFQANQQALKDKRQLIYFPICGIIQFNNISQRLKEIISQNKQFSLLIQIGYIENTKQLQVFLSQIILFRGFYFQQYIFLPKDTPVYVEIENIYTQKQKDQQYYVIQILKKIDQKRYYKLIKKFRQQDIIFDQRNKQDIYVYNYLKLINNGQISKKQLNYNQSSDLQYPLQEQCVQLIKKYFTAQIKNKKGQPTFLLYKSFMKMLFNLFRAFGDSPFFFIDQQQMQQYKFLRLKEVRLEFLKVCIYNTRQFLQQSVSTNSFTENQNKQDFQSKIKQQKLLIVPTIDRCSYEFVYLDDKSVPFVIKSLLIKQNFALNKKSRRISSQADVDRFFSETSLNHSKDYELLIQILQKLSHITQNQNLEPDVSAIENKRKTAKQVYLEIQQKIQALKSYKITIDNFFKMCLIIIRSLCKVPIIIMGESGVGKTALLKFLVQIVFKEKIIVKNVHAGIHEKQIKCWIQEIKKQCENQKKNIWVFFDQFNTSDQLSYFKQIIMDRRFMGKKLPQNIIFLAACNPYRLKKKNSVHAGLAYLSKNEAESTLAFKVKPPCLSMIQLMWDYQQLKQQQLHEYVKSMIKHIQFARLEELVRAIVYVHEYFKRQKELSSISLRDVYRFQQLYLWFLINMPKGPYKKKSQFDFYAIDRNERAIILSFCFCYCLRIQNQQDRELFLQPIDKMLGFSKNYILKVFQLQQRDYIKRLTIVQQKIALNATLMENLFATIVCLNNKIPLLIVGNPGSSKSLSVRIISSSFKGKNSTSQFCKQFPALNMFFFQGSQSSTSQGVQHIFQKAQEKRRKEAQFYEDKNQTVDFLNCILFDEIGLAEKSVHNPLKVLHSKLQTDQKQLGFIGISNYELDSAKMSRFLVLAHSNPDKKQLKKTAKKIYQSYFPQNQTHKQKFQELGKHYYKFLKRWNQDKSKIRNFFGLRDFYSYIKYICQQIKDETFSTSKFQKAVVKSVMANFAGQKGSVQLFYQIMGIKQQIKPQNPINLVKQNLANPQARCLMLIIKSDALIPLISQSIQICNESRDVICIYGSTFEDDKQSEQYNLQTTSKIITYLSRPTILTFKDLNNSIQTSLYDLFNKSFVKRSSYKTCRIAVGANSNPKCTVHEKFNSIIYVQEQLVQKLDLPFINRFQKHELSIKSMIDNYDIQLLQEIMQWIENILKSKPENTILKDENFIINCGEQAIVTLVIKYKENHDKIDKIKTQILQNRTTDFQIYAQSRPQVFQKMNLSYFVSKIIPWEQNPNDLIIYTYDQFPISSSEKDGYSFKIGEIKNQKYLKKSLQQAFKNQNIRKINIILDYRQQSQHLYYILFFAKQIKQSIESKKQIIIIVQLCRSMFITQKSNEINVSYLHRYDQYFVQNLSLPVSDLLRLQTMWDLFQQLNLQKKLQNLHFEALKSIKLSAEEGQDPQIIKEIFHSVSELINKDLYKNKLMKIFEKKLSNQKIDYSLLHADKSGSLYSANIFEAAEQYISKQLRSIIFELECLIVSQGLVFSIKQIINMKPKQHQQYIRERFQADTSKALQRLYEQKFEALIQKFQGQYFERNQQVKPKRFNPNLHIKVPIFQSLFCQSFKDFTKFFIIMKKESQNAQKILKQIPLSSEDDQQGLQKRQRYQKNAKRQLSEAQFHVFNKQSQFLARQLLDVYFYDIFMFRMTKLQLSPRQQCELIEFIYQLLSDFSLEDKIILLVYDANLSSLLCSLLITLFKKHKLNQLAYQTKEKLQDLPKNSYIIKLTQSLLEKSYQIMDLTQENIRKFKGPQEYVKYFRQIYEKIRNISRNYRSIRQFSSSVKIQSINSFIELETNLRNHYKQFEKDDFVENILKEERQGSLFLRIFKFVEKRLKKAQLDSGKQLIINYLSLRVFSDWFDSINEYPEQQKECIQNFKNLCNEYSLFANNSSFYFNTVFVSLQDLEILQMLKIIRQNKDSFKIDEKWITFKDHFSVAIGNHLNSLISRSIEQQLDGQQNSFIIRKYEQLFKEFCNENSSQGLESIFAIQFLKIYGQKYLELLEQGQQIEILNDFEKYLSKDTLFASHLRIYLLKCIYHRQETFQNIDQKYLRVQRCKWINTLKEYIEEKKIEYFIPPSLKKYQHKQESEILKLIQLFQKSRYSNMQIYHKLLNQVLFQQIEPSNCLQILTFFLMKIFNQSYCHPQTREKLRKQLLQRGDFKQERNKIVVSLLDGYLRGQVIDDIRFNNEDYKDQIVLLNYFNIIISLRRLKMPATEMYFDNHGNSINNYEHWLNERYLLGSQHNPALQRLLFIERQHKKGKKASSYTICSSTCDYTSPIGGTFYGADEGCPHPTSSAKCPFCGGVLGAQLYNRLINEQKGARVIIPQQIPNEIQRVKVKQQLNIIYKDEDKLIKLKGYHIGFDQRQIYENLQIKKHLEGLATDNLEQLTSIATNYLQCFINNLFWYFASSFNLIENQSCQNIWGRNSKQMINQFRRNYQFYHSQIYKELALSVEDFIVWNLGIAKSLFEFNLEFSTKGEKLTLLHSSDRDYFQKRLEDYLYRFYDTEKQKLILQSRNLLELRKSDIIKEVGSLNQHEAEYKFIRMFKIIKEKPGLQNLKKFYKTRLHKDYPILAYLIYSQEVEQRLKNYKTIFAFLSKIQRQFNEGIKRKQSEKSLKEMLQQDKGLQPFIKCWNSIADRNLQLQLDCHDSNTLGTLPKLSKQTPLKAILYDKNTINNEHAQRLIAFTIIASRQYNDVCNLIQGLYSNAYPQLQSTLYSKIKLNPTCIEDQKLMLTFHEQKLNAFVQNLSFQSVQYGISTSHYSFQKIQRLIVREFVGCRYLQTQREKYNYIRYIGEQIEFITNLRNQPKQQTLQSLGLKQQVDKYLEKNQKVLEKIIKQLQSSLQKIIIFYYSIKLKDIGGQTIDNFIESNGIRGINEQFRRQLLHHIPLSGLADLYQLIQYNSLKNVENIIAVAYHQGELQKHQKAIIQKIKSQNNPTLPSFKDFKRALYCFAGRSLINATYNQQQKLSEHLCIIEDYWPKEMDKKKISQELKKDLQILTLSKVGAILRQIPFKQMPEANRIHKAKEQKIVDKQSKGKVNNKGKKTKDL